MTAAPLPPTAPPLQPEIGELVAGKYRIDGVIGEGGMGTVFAACHQITEKRCALKWLRPEREGGTARLRFQQEARAAGRIHHPNVVSVYDVGEHRGATFLVMELLEGPTLRKLLDAGELGIQVGVDFVAQAARGVAAAHAAAVLHRDLKPENLLITRGAHGEPLVKVLDFGISKIDAEQGAELMTRSGALLGTPLYMAPERLFGEASDARADIYSLSVILYECLTGRLPYQADTAAALGRCFANQLAVPPASSLRPGLPPLVDDVIMHALSLNPSQRVQSATQLATTLEELLGLIEEEPEPAAAASLASNTALRRAQTTIDSTTGRDRAAVRRDELVVAADSQSTARQPTAVRRWLVPVVAIALLCGLVTWWMWPQERAQPMRTPEAPAKQLSHDPSGQERPVDSLPGPAPEQAVRAPDAPTSAPGAQPVPVPDKAAAPRGKSGKSRVPGAPTAGAPQKAQEEPELGRSKAQFTPKDFY